MGDRVQGYVEWLTLHRSEETIRNFRLGVEKFIAFADRNGLCLPEQVDWTHIERYLVELRVAGRCATTINLRLCALRSFWKYLRRYGYAANSPPSDVDRLRTSRRLPRYLSVEEQQIVLSRSSKRKGKNRRQEQMFRRDGALVSMALLAGLRCNELRNLRLGDIDLLGKTVRVTAGKGDRDRELPMVCHLVDSIREYLPIRAQLTRNALDSPWLFVTIYRVAGRQIGKKSICDIAYRTTQACLDRTLPTHALRHSFAAKLRARGADLQLIQEALGHARLDTTTIYAHLPTDQRRAQLEMLLR